MTSHPRDGLTSLSSSNPLRMLASASSSLGSNARCPFDPDPRLSVTGTTISSTSTLPSEDVAPPGCDKSGDVCVEDDGVGKADEDNRDDEERRDEDAEAEERCEAAGETSLSARC